MVGYAYMHVPMGRGKLINQQFFLGTHSFECIRCMAPFIHPVLSQFFCNG